MVLDGKYFELDQLIPVPFSRGRFTPYSDRLHDFSVTDVYVNSFSPGTARLYNSLPIECFLSLELRDTY